MKINRAKGIFTIIMIVAHAVQLLGDANRFPDFHVSFYGNLIAFSGFILCFGYTSGRPNRTIYPTRILSSIGRIYVAYISIGVTYQLFKLREINILDLFFFKELAGYAQFLLAFMLYAVILAIGYPFLGKHQVKIYLGLALCLSFFSTLFPLSNHLPLVWSLFWPMQETTSFPILSYAPILLLGAYLSQHSHIWIAITRWSLLAILVCVVSWEFIFYPERFPVSFLWIVTSIPFSLALLGCTIIASDHVLLEPLATLGSRSLSILVISNSIFFMLSEPLHPWELSSILTFLALAISGFWGLYLLGYRTVQRPSRHMESL